ncbi:MAG: type I methionyl aminopeptidase [Bowdeniella nasicola]|nr:type I methionyl aminopeptidase [Bowdeniella nasicola]
MIFGPRPEIKTRSELAAMAEAGAIVCQMLDAVSQAVEVGISTAELDAIAERTCRQAGAKPNFKGYYGFPATICTSINDEIVHGIPTSQRFLADGDVLSVDCGCSIAGTRGRRWHGDSARTFLVGNVRPEVRQLSDITREAMWAGIAALAGARDVGVVGAAVEDVVACNPINGAPLDIVTEYVGHGIGTAMHQVPDVPNYRVAGRQPKIKDGMALCVEPMLTLGQAENRTLDDEWTVVTTDGSPAAHWEHAVAIIDGTVRVLTAADGGAAELAKRGITIAELA